MNSKEKAQYLDALNRLYLNLESPVALTSNLKKLTAAAQAQGIPRHVLLKYLQAEPAYTMHRPSGPKRFERSKTLIPPAVDGLWQADLVEMKDTKGMIAKNRRVKFLLTVVDTLSKYAWVEVLPNKKGGSMAVAFRRIFEDSGRVPVQLQTDEGKEFYNGSVARVLEEFGVEEHYSTLGEPKAAMVERFNRTAT